MALADAQSALSAADLQGQVVRQTDDTHPDGTVTAQDPIGASSLAAGGTVTLTVAQHSNGTYLSTLHPVDVEGQYGEVVGPARLNGQTYAHAVTSRTDCSTPVVLQYDLGRAYQHFKTTVGLADESNNSTLVQFDVLVDNKPVFSQQARLGQALAVDVSVTDGLRLEIEATRVEKPCTERYGDASTTAVWADALLTD
jgi:hypothetical protein